MVCCWYMPFYIQFKLVRDTTNASRILLICKIQHWATSTLVKKEKSCFFIFWYMFTPSAGPSPGLTTVTLWVGSSCSTSPTADPSRTSTIGWRRLAATSSRTASSSSWWGTNATWRRSARCVQCGNVSRDTIWRASLRMVAVFKCYVIRSAALKITFCSNLDQHTFGSEAGCHGLFNSQEAAGRQKAKISPLKFRHYRMTLQKNVPHNSRTEVK